MIVLLSTNARSDVVEFNDREEWEQAVGPFQTIDFTELPPFTIVTDQYNHLGVTFTDGDDWIRHWAGFLNDGAGLMGGFNNIITVEFDDPQSWIALHGGLTGFKLYDESGLFYTSNLGGGTLFYGLLSTVQFTKAVLYTLDGVTLGIDDLLWGMPSPGAISLLSLAILFGGSRRRGGVS